MKTIPLWILFALGSAFFAALTALLGKMGVSDVNSNLATLIRTFVIIVLTCCILTYRHEWQPLNTLSPAGLLFLVLSGVATGPLMVMLLSRFTAWASLKSSAARQA